MNMRVLKNGFVLKEGKSRYSKKLRMDFKFGT